MPTQGGCWLNFGSFYEKVVKVKADVAAIVNFSPDRAHRGRQSGAGTPVVLIGGIRVTAVFASEYGSEV